jgi:carboxyl-terminal processing protease
MRSFNFLRYFTLVLLLLSASGGLAQVRYTKIETFTKVWGFLKYHHPKIAGGGLNWDSIYISMVPKVQNLSAADFNGRLLRIIDGLGPLQKDEAVKTSDTLFDKNHDLQWIGANKTIHSKLKSRLKDIYTYRNRGENKYIKLSYSTADYSGENQYENLGFPDQNYRLLFLARFWNAINYFAPYKYEIGEDWGNVLTRFIPRMINSADTLSYYKTLMQLAVSLNDGHAQFTIANGNAAINNLVFGKYAAPIFADIVDDHVIIRKLAVAPSDLLQGDVVLSIDGEPVAKRIKRIGALTSASNNVSRNKSITWVLFNTHSDHLSLKIKRGTKIFTVNVKCMPAADRSWRELNNHAANETGYETIGSSILRVYAAQIWRGNIDTIKTLLKRHKAVIFDVRNYPNNDDFYKLFDVFLREPKVINQSLILSVSHPGYFKWQPSPVIGRVNALPYKGKVIILADERTQSQGEYSVMALQTIPGSVTIGSQTAGGDGVQTNIPIGNKMALAYSGYGIFYPDKTPTQRRGIRIDIEAGKTAESISKGRDIALEKALTYLSGKGIE